MKLILMLLSVYRITHMIVYETGPLAIFEKLRGFLYKKANEDILEFDVYSPDIGTSIIFWDNIDEGINCSYCVSVWISGIVWIVSKIKFIGSLFVGIFGLAGAWMVLNDLMEKLESDDD